MDKEAIRAKRKARRIALQALYQWQMSASDLYEIEAQYRLSNDMQKIDSEYFSRLLHRIPSELAEIDALFEPYLDRTIKELNPIELAVLRLGTFELSHCLEIPYKVVLDESVLLTKTFGAQDGYKYVNGVLNQVARKTREAEINRE